MRLLKCLLLYSFKWEYRAIKPAEGIRLRRSSKEDGSAKCGFVDHASDLAGVFLQLPLSRALWLCDSPEAHGSVPEPLQVWARWVAEDADLGGAALRLEQLPPGCLQAGEESRGRRGWGGSAGISIPLGSGEGKGMTGGCKLSPSSCKVWWRSINWKERYL